MGSKEKLRRSSSADAAERLALIVDAAERAALQVIDDAEKEARRYIEEAQERADRIVAERLRELADKLDAEPEEGPEVEPDAEIDAEPAAPVRHLRRVEPAPDDDGGDTDEQREQSESSEARLLATQMAISGSSRREIEMRLRNGFALEDTSGILDAILGPEA